MKLSEAVAHYVARRRSEGVLFVHNASVLKLFCSHCGDISLSELSADQISSYIYSQKISPTTRSTRYSIVNGFLIFYRVRRLINLIQVQKPMWRRDIRLPIIYSQGQIRSLLKGATNITTKANCLGDEMDGSTFRMILLVLYATGATVSEVVGLRRLNVDLRRRCIEFKGTPRHSCRRLPIGRDLCRELGKYIRTHCKNSQDTFVFRFKSGREIKRDNVWNRFGRLCGMVGIPASRDGHVPRLHDLRATFAVHRLSSAIHAGQNLNDLIPALSTYLGSSVLTRAEHYLAFIPERFSADLEKLSSTKPRTRWRDKPELLDYLGSL
jgi:integrase/recombinase XerD